MDTKNRRLFSTSAPTRRWSSWSADSGTVIDTVGDRPRAPTAAAFDPGTGLAYSSNGGDGTLTVVGETEAGTGKFKVVATIPTQASARTMTFDPKTHRVYLSAATQAPAPAPAAAGADQPKTKGGRRGNVPGSFVIIVVGD